MAFSKIAAENLGGSTLPALAGGSLTGLAGIDVADHFYLHVSTTAGTNGVIGDTSDAGGEWRIHKSLYSNVCSCTTGSGGGKFTFSKTGHYLIMASLQFYMDTADNDWAFLMEFTTNNWSSDSDIGYSRVCNNSGDPNNYIQNANNYLLDVTNTTNDSFRFKLSSTSSGNQVYGATSDAQLSTTCQIIRLGDT